MIQVSPKFSDTLNLSKSGEGIKPSIPKLFSPELHKCYFLYNHKQIHSKVPMLLYFVGPKRPSGNCYISSFLTDKTALLYTDFASPQKIPWLRTVILYPFRQIYIGKYLLMCLCGSKQLPFVFLLPKGWNFQCITTYVHTTIRSFKKRLFLLD